MWSGLYSQTETPQQSVRASSISPAVGRTAHAPRFVVKWQNRPKWPTTSRMKTGPHAWAFLIVFSLSALGPQTWAQAVSPAALADYQAKLAQYQAARAPYEAEADAYWDAIAAKRRIRN